MSLKEEFVKLLQCPACKGDIDFLEEGVLICKTCGRKYQVVNGIIKMLLNEKEGSD